MHPAKRIHWKIEEKPVMISRMTSLVSPFSQWYRGWVQGKTRVLLAWIFSILLVFSARTYPQAPGIAVCFLGALLRFWASGHLRKDRHPAIGGPYTLTRNPLYFGTYLMALGTALAIQSAWLFVTVTILFAAVYHFIVLDEETKLERIFGASYLQYCRLVPRFFPRLWPTAYAKLKEVNPISEDRWFSWKVAWENKAYEAFLSFIGLIGAASGIAWMYETFSK